MTSRRVWLARFVVAVLFGPVAYTYAVWDTTHPGWLAVIAPVALGVYFLLLYWLSIPDRVAGHQTIPSEYLHFLEDGREITRRRLAFIAVVVYCLTVVVMFVETDALMAMTAGGLAGSITGVLLAATIPYWAVLRLLSSRVVE